MTRCIRVSNPKTVPSLMLDNLENGYRYDPNVDCGKLKSAVSADKARKPSTVRPNSELNHSSDSSQTSLSSSALTVDHLRSKHPKSTRVLDEQFQINVSGCELIEVCTKHDTVIMEKLECTSDKRHTQTHEALIKLNKERIIVCEESSSKVGGFPSSDHSLDDVPTSSNLPFHDDDGHDDNFDQSDEVGTTDIHTGNENNFQSSPTSSMSATVCQSNSISSTFNQQYKKSIESTHESELGADEQFLSNESTSRDGSDVPNHLISENNTNLIVNYLPSQITQEEVRALFATVGEVDSCKLIKDKTSNQNLGYGFVNYMHAHHAELAIASLNGLQLENKTIKVSLARPSSDSIKGANLYISGLPTSLTEMQLQDLFKSCGRIITSRILYDSNTGVSRGVGFIRFDQRAEAEKAIQSLNGVIPENASEPITVKMAYSPSSVNHTNSQNGLNDGSDSSLTKNLTIRPNLGKHSNGKVHTDDWKHRLSLGLLRNVRPNGKPQVAALTLMLQQLENSTGSAWPQWSAPMIDSFLSGACNPPRLARPPLIADTSPKSIFYPTPSQLPSGPRQQHSNHVSSNDAVGVGSPRFVQPMFLSNPNTQLTAAFPNNHNQSHTSFFSPPPPMRYRYPNIQNHANNMFGSTITSIPEISPSFLHSKTFSLPDPTGAAFHPYLMTTRQQPNNYATFLSPNPFFDGSNPSLGHLISLPQNCAPSIPIQNIPLINPPPIQTPNANWFNAPILACNSLYVNNLPADCEESLLWRLFGPFGAVQSVKVVRDAAERKCRGYGFVNMPNYLEAFNAINHLNGFILGDRRLQVAFKSTPIHPSVFTQQQQQQKNQQQQQPYVCHSNNSSNQ